MSDYHSIGSDGRLGGFELHGVSNTFGNQGFEGLGAAGDAAAGEVLGGIGAILGSITGPLAEIYVSHRRSELELERIKRGVAPTAAAPTAAEIAYRQEQREREREQAAKKKTTTIIIVIVVGVIAFGAFMMMRGGRPAYGPPRRGGYKKRRKKHHKKRK